MGKSSRRNRMRNAGAPSADGADESEFGTWVPGSTPGYDVNGVPLPPGCPGSLFDVFKIDPRPGVNGGLFQMFIMELEPWGKLLRAAEEEKEWVAYAFAARSALGEEEYNKMYSAVHEYDRAVAEGMTDIKAINARVRAFAGLGEPISLLGGE
jgi:hypothetical protein